MFGGTKLNAMESIRVELDGGNQGTGESRGSTSRRSGLYQRTCSTWNDKEIGYCHGIENYSRHSSENGCRGSAAGRCWINLPHDAVMFLDEATKPFRNCTHDTTATGRAKRTGITRIPAAEARWTTRPLTSRIRAPRQSIGLRLGDAGPYELTKSAGVVVEQIIRPTGLVDPSVEIRPVKGQVDDLLGQIPQSVEAGQRVLVTTLTKRMSEDLAEYYSEVGVRCRYCIRK